MWFSVGLLFKSVHPDHPENQFLWEERVFLVQAEHEDEARRKAKAIGSDEEHEYKAANGDLVRWKFEQIESVFPIDSETLQNGTELYSRFLDTSEVRSLLAPFKE